MSIFVVDLLSNSKKIEAAPPEGQLHKKNKKGLASVILATNSPFGNW